MAGPGGDDLDDLTFNRPGTGRRVVLAVGGAASLALLLLGAWRLAAYCWP